MESEYGFASPRARPGEVDHHGRTGRDAMTGLHPLGRAGFERAIRPAGSLLDAPASHVVFWQDEASPRMAVVEDGLVRAVRVSSRGERQILCFFWPGDMVSPPGEDGPRFTAETVTRSRLRWLDRDEDRLQRGTERMLHELVGLLGVMVHRSAPARLAWFLLRMRPHLPPATSRDETETLRCLVPRADMADHLGMASETVCRLLGEFQDVGMIALPTRKSIRFIDSNRLARLAHS
jgi:CRP/FNR family transcriptional regulator, anaerobic regulatory protein